MEGERGKEGEGRYEGIWREEERGRYGGRKGRKRGGRKIWRKGRGEMKGHVGGKRTLLMKEG